MFFQVRIQQIILLGLCISFGGCALLPLTEDWDSSSSDRHLASSAAPTRQPLPEVSQTEYREAYTAALDRRDVILGMSMDDVRSVWGEPVDVQVAGHPGMGNQKWIYFNGLSTRWSVSSARVIYFEQGRVVGWETK